MDTDHHSNRMFGLVIFIEIMIYLHMDFVIVRRSGDRHSKAALESRPAYVQSVMRVSKALESSQHLHS